MIGQPYNPANCTILSNQALNANQFNQNVPNASNNVPHIFLWDFVANKMYWVNSLTNLIEQELSSASAGKEVAFKLYIDSFDFENPVKVSVLVNTENLIVTASKVSELSIGEYKIIFNQPIFAVPSIQYMVEQGPENRELIYNVGFLAPETLGRKIQIWTWYKEDDYTMIIETGYIEGVNDNVYTKEDLTPIQLGGGTQLPITLRF